jgi:hypothetical protein
MTTNANIEERHTVVLLHDVEDQGRRGSGTGAGRHRRGRPPVRRCGRLRGRVCHRRGRDGGRPHTWPRRHSPHEPPRDLARTTARCVALLCRSLTASSLHRWLGGAALLDSRGQLTDGLIERGVYRLYGLTGRRRTLNRSLNVCPRKGYECLCPPLENRPCHVQSHRGPQL